MTQQNNEFERWWEKAVNTIELGLWKNTYPDNTWQYTNHTTNLAWITWQAAKADSEREIAELKASNELLHDALESNQISEKELLSYRAHINDLREALEFYNDAEFPYRTANDALTSTPAQSLQAHDNEVIERCAKVCENMDSDGYSTIEQLDCANSIRELKGKV